MNDMLNDMCALKILRTFHHLDHDLFAFSHSVEHDRFIKYLSRSLSLIKPPTK